MNTEIINALIGFAGVCVGAILGYMGKNKRQAILDAKREQEQMDNMALILDEMNEIKKRLDQHNKYAEKFGDIEKSIVSIKKDIQYIRRDTDGKIKE
jgi:hypothetical protein